MWIENWKEYIEPKETSTKTELESLKQQINLDQKTIQALSYLTTFFRLDKNRDLNELFDGEVKLWEEELLAIYSLLELINWANTISSLKIPKTMNLNIDWKQDYNFKLNYNLIEKNKKIVNQISSIIWSWALPLSESKLTFIYNSEKQIDKIQFERPRLGFEQEIKVKRTNWLANEISIKRELDLDNDLTIKYNNLWKPALIEQTKTWLFTDKMVFEYDEKWNLLSIIYIPALSLKNIKWALNDWKKWSEIWWALERVEIDWEYLTFTTLKQQKWVDYLEILAENWLIKSTNSDLSASQWIYKKWFSENKYSQDWQLEKVYLEKEEFWPDQKKSLTIEY